MLGGCDTLLGVAQERDVRRHTVSAVRVRAERDQVISGEGVSHAPLPLGVAVRARCTPHPRHQRAIPRRPERHHRNEADRLVALIIGRVG